MTGKFTWLVKVLQNLCAKRRLELHADCSKSAKGCGYRKLSPSWKRENLVCMPTLSAGETDRGNHSVAIQRRSESQSTGADVRRFRPNIVVRSTRAVPFEEDEWVGGVLAFGDGDNAPAVAVKMRDVRCAMVNIDPDNGALPPKC
jgi:hypothetical protein